MEDPTKSRHFAHRPDAACSQESLGKGLAASSWHSCTHKALPALAGATVMLSNIRHRTGYTGRKERYGEIKQCHQGQREQERVKGCSFK